MGFFSDLSLLGALLPLEVSSFCASTSITRALMHTWVVKVAHSKPNIPRALLMGKELTIVIPNIEDIILKMARKFKRLLVLFKVKKKFGDNPKDTGFRIWKSHEGWTYLHLFLDDFGSEYLLENLISGAYTQINPIVQNFNGYCF